MILGGNQAFRTDVEMVAFSKGLSVCTKPASMPDQYSKGSVGAYINGKVVLCGGLNAGKQCHEYIIQSQMWVRSAYHLHDERIESAGSLLHNGSWLLIGGKGVDKEPISTTEMLENGLFMPNMLWPEFVSLHCCAYLNSSHIFISGGEGPGRKLLDTSYFLNVELSYWKSVEERMTHKRSGHACGFTIEGDDIYAIVAGGFENLAVELLNLSKMRWRVGPSLMFEMNHVAGFQFGLRFLLIGGEHIGYCSKPYLCYSSDAIFELDIGNFLWKSQSQSLMLPRSKHIVIPLPDDLELCQETSSTHKGTCTLL